MIVSVDFLQHSVRFILHLARRCKFAKFLAVEEGLLVLSARHIVPNDEVKTFKCLLIVDVL